MTRKGIPERWEKYLPVGCRVPGTRFLPFKVPLKPELFKHHSEKEWFTPGMLVEGNPSLKAVIDLTNTNRYYNCEELTKRGLLYKKINIVGGGNVPTEKIREKFFDAVDELSEILQDDADALIGVHCTHGLNRTGYLICKYMVLRMKIDPEEAINNFQKARGYPIERINYVSDIRGAPSAPTCRRQIPETYNNWRRDESSRDRNDNWRSPSLQSTRYKWRSNLRESDFRFKRNDDRRNNQDPYFCPRDNSYRGRDSSFQRTTSDRFRYRKSHNYKY